MKHKAIARLGWLSLLLVALGARAELHELKPGESLRQTVRLSANALNAPLRAGDSLALLGRLRDSAGVLKNLRVEFAPDSGVRQDVAELLTQGANVQLLARRAVPPRPLELVVVGELDRNAFFKAARYDAAARRYVLAAALEWDGTVSGERGTQPIVLSVEPEPAGLNCSVPQARHDFGVLDLKADFAPAGDGLHQVSKRALAISGPLSCAAVLGAVPLSSMSNFRIRSGGGAALARRPDAFALGATRGLGVELRGRDGTAAISPVVGKALSLVSRLRSDSAAEFSLDLQAYLVIESGVLPGPFTGAVTLSVEHD